MKKMVAGQSDQYSFYTNIPIQLYIRSLDYFSKDHFWYKRPGEVISINRKSHSPDMIR